MFAIQLKNIDKSFGKKKVLNNLSLQIRENEMVALIGPSGCGKTTLLNILGLIEPYDSGEYLLFGKQAPQCNSNQANQTIRRYISYLFQNFALVDNFTVEQNLMIALKYTRKTKQEKHALINEALNKVGLSEYNELKIFEISGGEQQRVALARAMIKPSKIILADEPTGALDSKAAQTLLETFTRINKCMQATILMVTHDAFSASYCDRILFLKDGKIFNELVKGDKSRRDFLNEILDILALTGGDNDVK